MSVDPGIQNSHARSALKEFPQESFILAHAATRWKEDAEATLAGLKLLAVAQGGNHPEADAIIDVDLSAATEELYQCLMHVLVYLGRSKNLGISFSAPAHSSDASKIKA